MKKGLWVDFSITQLHPSYPVRMGIIGIFFLVIMSGICFCVSCIMKSHINPLTPIESSSNRTPKKGIDIDRAMAYPFTHILKRYQKDYGVSEQVAHAHEHELKRFLIIGAENYPETTDMFSAEVDDLWHTFLLFTREYKYFCEEILGEFVHHVPKEKISDSTKAELAVQ